MESSGRDAVAPARTLCVGIAGHFVMIAADDAPAILGEDPSGQADKALDELSKAGCDRLVLLYILKVMRLRLPCYWWASDESREEAKRRRDDAAVFDQAAAIIKERYAFFLPKENMTPEDEQNLRGWDQLALMQGSISAERLLLGIESVAENLRAPDEFRVAAALRSNQDDFDMISRCVFCAYIQRITGEWHDREAAALLTQIGNHKGDQRNATFDGENLRHWRANNQTRLKPLSSWAVDQLVSLTLPSVESPSPN